MREVGQAKELVEKMLTFIEQVSKRKLRFSSIVDLNTGATSDPTDRLVAAVNAALRRAKAEGMREAAGRICMFCANLDGEWANSIKTDFVRHVHSISGRIAECKAWAIRAGIVELEKADARAAQIEEGA